MAKLIQSTPKLTVLILTAGHGRRMGAFSRMLNKSLIPYNNKPLISHIINKFDIDTKFVIAIGHLGQQVKDYIDLVHDSLNVTYVDIIDYDEGHTGPGTSIRKCADYLPESFMWISCDTLFKFEYKDKLDHNWIAVHPVDSAVSKDYCWVQRNGEIIRSIHNKEQAPNAVDAFIGLMYVKDGTDYIQSLSDLHSKEVYEGFRSLDLKAHSVSEWLDFGTYDKWKILNNEFPELSFPKPDEAFYYDNKKIIKFSTNADLTKSKYLRARINPSCMPTNLQQKGNFLAYNYESGSTLYNNLTPDIFRSFLQWVKDTMWSNNIDTANKYDASIRFYKKKTLQRVELFRTKYQDWNELPIVNGLYVKDISEYINMIDFEWLANTSKFVFIHGDMQPENIIYNESTCRFTAIDWRPDFAGEMGGDLYYDIAKLLGGLYLSYRDVKRGWLKYEENDNNIHINIPSVNNVQTFVEILKGWTIAQGLEWKKVQVLMPIIYLNMAPLHDAPFDKYLIALSQYFFSQIL